MRILVIRVNVVSPPWVDETLKAMTGHRGLPAFVVARAYAQAVSTRVNGTVIEAE